MKKSEIQVNKQYEARMSGRIVTVKVTAIREVISVRGRSSSKVVYDVTNLSTGRKTTFRSAVKFRRPVIDGQAVGPEKERPDSPTLATMQDTARRLKRKAQKEQGPPPNEKYIGGYTCRYCGQHHATDDQGVWCMLARERGQDQAEAR